MCIAYILAAMWSGKVGDFLCLESGNSVSSGQCQIMLSLSDTDVRVAMTMLGNAVSD